MTVATANEHRRVLALTELAPHPPADQHADILAAFTVISNAALTVQ